MAVEVCELVLEPLRVLLGQRREVAALLPLSEIVEALDALLDGHEVREESAEPTLVHVVHPAALCLLGNGFLRLLFGPDEKDLPSISGEVAHECVCLFPARPRAAGKCSSPRRRPSNDETSRAVGPSRSGPSTACFRVSPTKTSRPFLWWPRARASRDAPGIWTFTIRRAASSSPRVTRSSTRGSTSSPARKWTTRSGRSCVALATPCSVVGRPCVSAPPSREKRDRPGQRPGRSMLQTVGESR